MKFDGMHIGVQKVIPVETFLTCEEISDLLYMTDVECLQTGENEKCPETSKIQHFSGPIPVRRK